jgi:hypothetical protein
MKNKFVLLMVVLLGSNTFSAAYVQDAGKIKTLFVSSSGNIAVQLENGFPNSNAGGQCATANLNSFGGNVTADPVFKATLLAAKAAQQNVTLTVQGCEAGGAWFKVIDVYVN